MDSIFDKPEVSAQRSHLPHRNSIENVSSRSIRKNQTDRYIETDRYIQADKCTDVRKHTDIHRVGGSTVLVSECGFKLARK